MTKEELMKKRGIKTSTEQPKSAAEAILTGMREPVEETKKEEPVEPVEEVKETPEPVKAPKKAKETVKEEDKKKEPKKAPKTVKPKEETPVNTEPEKPVVEEKQEEVTAPVVVQGQNNNISFSVEIKPPVEEEIYCVRKQVVLKPSVNAKLDKILKERKISFNSVVNQFLEAFVEDAGSIDVPHIEK